MLYLRENKNLIIRRALSLVFIFCCFLLQSSGVWIPDIFGVNAFILIPAVVCIGMFERETWGAIAGLFAGMLWDSIAARGQGYHAVVLMVAGFLCGFLVRYMMRNNFMAALCLCGGLTLVHNVIFWLFYFVFARIDGAFLPLWRIYLPSVAYTLLFLPIMYFPVRAVAKSLRREPMGREPEEE